MPLGMEVGLGPFHIVLDGEPASQPKSGHGPQFSACLLWPNDCIRIPIGMEVSLSLGDTVLDGDLAPPHLKWHIP